MTTALKAAAFASLAREMTPDEAEQILAESRESLTNAAVAEATRRIPAAFGAVLRSPGWAPRWLIALHDAEAELCAAVVRFGYEGDEYRLAKNMNFLADVRMRIGEAAKAADATFDVPADAVMSNLLKTYPRRYRRLLGLAGERDRDLTPAVEDLRAMPDREFRDLVCAAVVQRCVENAFDTLALPPISDRTHRALWELGEMTCRELGIDTQPDLAFTFAEISTVGLEERAAFAVVNRVKFLRHTWRALVEHRLAVAARRRRLELVARRQLAYRARKAVNS
jgi:hypothetical protein